ncbi:MAG: response regulator [Planctomycetota bacterium]
MRTGDLNILIVAEDGPIVAEIAKELLLDMQAGVSIVSTIDEARTISAESNFDVVLASATLSDGEGVTLASGPEADSTASVIVMLNRPAGSEQVLDLIRQGASDVLAHPLDMNGLIESVRRVGGGHRTFLSTARRAKRLRRMTSRLVRDRRELRQRVDLICRDLVTAYQRLAEKVVDVRQGVSEADSN